MSKSVERIHNIWLAGCLTLSIVGLVGCDVSQIVGEEEAPPTTRPHPKAIDQTAARPQTLDRDGSDIVERPNDVPWMPPHRNRPLRPDEDGFVAQDELQQPVTPTKSKRNRPLQKDEDGYVADSHTPTLRGNR